MYVCIYVHVCMYVLLFILFVSHSHSVYLRDRFQVHVATLLDSTMVATTRSFVVAIAVVVCLKTSSTFSCRI